MAKPHSKKESILLDEMQEDRMLKELHREMAGKRKQNKDPWPGRHKFMRREINRQRRREPIEEE